MPAIRTTRQSRGAASLPKGIAGHRDRHHRPPLLWLAQILCIAACVVVGAAIMATRTGDPGLWAIVGAAVVTSALRVVGVLAFHRRPTQELILGRARRWESWLGVAALTFAMVIAS